MSDNHNFGTLLQRFFLPLDPHFCLDLLQSLVLPEVLDFSSSHAEWLDSKLLLRASLTEDRPARTLFPHTTMAYGAAIVGSEPLGGRRALVPTELLTPFRKRASAVQTSHFGILKTERRAMRFAPPGRALRYTSARVVLFVVDVEPIVGAPSSGTPVLCPGGSGICGSPPGGISNPGLFACTG